MKCEHGMEDCMFRGMEHDEDCCFNGIWTHDYICQECGFTSKAQIFSKRVNDGNMYIAPTFKPKNCPKCGTKKSLV